MNAAPINEMKRGERITTYGYEQRKKDVLSMA